MKWGRTCRSPRPRPPRCRRLPRMRAARTGRLRPARAATKGPSGRTCRSSCDLACDVADIRHAHAGRRGDVDRARDGTIVALDGRDMAPGDEVVEVEQPVAADRHAFVI